MSKKNSNNYRILDPALEPYIIQYDQTGFTVFKKITSLENNEREHTVGYYSSMDACLNAIAKDATKSQEHSTVLDFVEFYVSKLESVKQIAKLPL